MPTAKQLSALTPVERLTYWITERESIRRKKEAKKSWPWTDDLILRTYRFCNVHREDDKVTRWIKFNWRDRHSYDPHLWHAMIVARFINWPETLRVIHYPEPWLKRKRTIAHVLKERQASGQKVFTGAYIVSTNGAPMNKVEYVLGLFDRAWASELMHRNPISMTERTASKIRTLRDTHAALMTINGIGSFMAAQVVADLKHTPYLRNAADWSHWAAPGPGSMRGLSKVRGVSTQYRWKPQEFIDELELLREQVRKTMRFSHLDLNICLQDLQNCLCEYDKYTRVLFGKGRPRAKYHPASSQMQLLGA